MFPVNRKNSQAGFSLVELMVVVAIIGILAAVAIPNMSKYMAKSRQSEAKTNLAALYTAQKVFSTEYNGYFGAFQQIGFAPEGRLRYSVGFSALGTAPTGYTSTGGTDFRTNSAGTAAYCGIGGTMTNGCSVLPGYNNTYAAAPGGTAPDATTFQGQATARLMGATDDTWQIDQQKIVSQVTNGIN